MGNSNSVVQPNAGKIKHTHLRREINTMSIRRLRRVLLKLLTDDTIAARLLEMDMKVKHSSSVDYVMGDQMLNVENIDENTESDWEDEANIS
jgi:hypothetical protein